MNESWHIPRASLAGSSALSSSNSSKSYSNPSTVSRNFKIANDSSHKAIAKIDRHQRIDRKSTIPHGTYQTDDGRRWASSSSSRNNANTRIQPKRGSRSSQGSSDSNNSSQSISSGSLLLTAANLERFAEIHKKQNKTFVNQKEEQFLNNSNYNTNLMLASLSPELRKDAVISIEQNLDFIKTKDVDTVSMASSTHFTMVNGEGGPSRKTTGGICSRGKQVTVLITTMSLFFLFVIIGMVYALELRAREMPKS